MSKEGRNSLAKSQEGPDYFRGARHARRNPYPMMLLLALISSSLLFLGLLGMLLARKYSVGIDPIRIPVVFWFSTMIIGASSGTLWLAVDYHKKEQYRQYLNWLGITGLLGLTFLLAQPVGGLQLFLNGQTLADSPATAFLIILAGLHYLHLTMAIGFLGWLVMDASRHRTYVDGFIQSLNPTKQTRLELIVWLWHFLDALWIVLFACFVLLLSV